MEGLTLRRITAGAALCAGTLALGGCDNLRSVETSIEQGDGNSPAGTEAIVECKNENGTYRTQIKGKEETSNLALSYFPPTDHPKITKKSDCEW